MQSKFTKIAAALVLLAMAGPAPAATEHPAVTRARAVLKSQPTVFAVSAGDTFVVRDLVVDANGTEHVRFDRTWNGLPVIGGDVVVHSLGGSYRGGSKTLAAPVAVGTTPVVSADKAIVVAGSEFGPAFAGMPGSRQVVYARGKAGARLAWEVHLQNDMRDMTYYVDARTGTILDRWSNRETTATPGTARTFYLGDVPLTTDSVVGGYQLLDPTRGGMKTIDASNSRTSGQTYVDADNTWGNYTVADAATIAADAQYGAAVTWDYYLNVHGRRGIAADGKGARTRAHYGRRYSNAFWNDDCFCMTYGDGDGVSIGPLVSLDIAGHEMSHGVNSRTANLVYSGESGGLNEANSDILGTMVEGYARNAKDTFDYMIGEKIILANVAGSPDTRALRYMFNPIRDGRSPSCYVSTLGDLDVHYSSGVANRFFYLLAEGSGARTYSGVDHRAPTCNGASVTGLGTVKARAIWYRALTVYFTATTDYAGARVATIQAAKDLYGATSTEQATVASAWAAVSVL